MITAVTPLSFSQRNRRRSSERSSASLVKPPNSDSMVSSTMRFAPTESIAKPRRTKSPSRSYSPVSAISARSTRTWSIASFLSSTRASRSKPSERTFCASSSPVSSKLMKAPGSPNCVAPRTRNSIASSVLPQPGPPHTSVGRPFGSPPPVISSRPSIPVGAFGSARAAVCGSIFICVFGMVVLRCG